MDQNTVTATAAAFSTLASAVSSTAGLSFGQVALYLLGGLAAILGSTSFTQHALELIYAYTKPPFIIKQFLPMAYSAVIGWMLKASGMDLATASIAAVSLHQLLDKWNEMPWAKSIDDKAMSWINSKLATKTAALLLALLLGAACLRADAPVAPTTETGLAGIVGLAGATGLYQMSDAGKFVSTPESVAGAQYNLCWGTYSLAADHSLDFSALWYASAGVGATAGLGSEYAAAWVAVGYEDLGALVAWNLGTGQPPLVGAQIKIPLHDLALTHGLDATFGNAHKLGAW